jgi:hypothetical protein
MLQQTLNLRLNAGVYKTVAWPGRTLVGGVLTVKVPDESAEDTYLEIEGDVIDGVLVFAAGPTLMPAYVSATGVWDMLVELQGVSALKPIAGGPVVITRGVG